MKERKRSELKITVYDPDDVNPDDFKFQSAKALDKKLRRAERIMSIEDPDAPGENINIHLRALAENEEIILNQTQATLSKDHIQKLVSTIVSKASDGEELTTTDITDIVVEKLAENNYQDISVDKFYRRLQMAIISPKGVTIEWLQRRNPVILDAMSDILDELSVENNFWILNRAITKEE